MGDLVDPEIDPADETPPLAAKPVSCLGDVWLLGPHRLLCGDARRSFSFSETHGQRPCGNRVRRSPLQRLHQIGSGSGQDQARRFRHGVRRNVEGAVYGLSSSTRWRMRPSIPSMAQSIMCAWIGGTSTRCSTAGKEVYSELKNLVVWTKTNAGQGSFYRSQHELIFVFKNGEGPHTNNFELGPARPQSIECLDLCRREFVSRGAARRAFHSPDRQAGGACRRRHARLLAARRHRARPLHRLRHHHSCRRARWSPRLWPRARSALCRCRNAPMAGVHQARRHPEGSRRDLRRRRGLTVQLCEIDGGANEQDEDCVRKPVGAGNGKRRGDYEVGYGRPPKEHPVQARAKRQSKRSAEGAKNEATILRNIFNRQIASARRRQDAQGLRA